MQKLIYINQTLTNAQSWLESTSSNTAWNNNANIYYRSLVFTNDGHLLTHGLDFSTAASWGVGLIYNPSEGGQTSSAAPTTDGSFYPVFVKNNGQISISWADITTPITSVGTITSGTWHGSTITVPYGGTGATSFTSGQVLIGNGTDPITTKAIDTSIDLTGSGTSNLVTSAAVVAAISAAFAANDAMVFKGGLGTGTNLLTDLPTSGYSAGWTYRVVDADTYAGKVCEAGDVVIAIKDGPSSGSSVIDGDWIVVQTNLDGALLITHLSGTDSGLKRKVFKDSGDNYLYINQLFRSITTNGTAYLADNVTTALNFVNGAGITITQDGGVKIAINNTVTAQTTANLFKIKYSAQGLITEGTAWDPSTISFVNVYTTRNGSTAANAVNLYDPDGTALSIAAGEGLNFFKDGNNLKIGHSTTGAASVAAVDRTYIKSLTIDTWGHITNVTTGTETVVNTWRPIYAYSLTNTNGESAGEIRSNSTGTAALSFGSDFLAKDVNTSNSDTVLPGSEIYLAWAEVDASGNVTYAV